MKKILIFGSSGLIGFGLSKFLARSSEYQVILAQRKKVTISTLKNQWYKIKDAGSFNVDYLKKLIDETNPDIIINCLGITKHRMDNIGISKIIFVNSVLPHMLCEIAGPKNIRLIQISTDCVFSGKKGYYNEKSCADSSDLYGKSKLLGELDNPRTLTIRTSTVGHENNTVYGLLDWFLAQKTECFGYEKAFFSGVTTHELANIIKKYILPDCSLSGLIHVGGYKINKFALLKIIANVYDKKIKIIPSDSLVIDRSFSSKKFYDRTGYSPKSWGTLISELRKHWHD